MKTYNIEVLVKHTFTVEANNPYEAYREAQEFNEYWADTNVEKITISNNREKDNQE